jgi:hypothetical protein
LHGWFAGGNEEREDVALTALTAGALSSLLASANGCRVDKPQARTTFRRRAACVDPATGYFFQLVMSSTLTSYFAIFAVASFCASTSTLLNASASL